MHSYHNTSCMDVLSRILCCRAIDIIFKYFLNYITCNSCKVIAFHAHHTHNDNAHLWKWEWALVVQNYLKCVPFSKLLKLEKSCFIHLVADSNWWVCLFSRDIWYLITVVIAKDSPISSLLVTRRWYNE